jgi:hypothetical protein
VVKNYLIICGTRIHHLHKLYTVNQPVWHNSKREEWLNSITDQ